MKKTKFGGNKKMRDYLLGEIRQVEGVKGSGNLQKIVKKKLDLKFEEIANLVSFPNTEKGYLENDLDKKIEKNPSSKSIIFAIGDEINQATNDIHEELFVGNIFLEVENRFVEYKPLDPVTSSINYVKRPWRSDHRKYKSFNFQNFMKNIKEKKELQIRKKEEREKIEKEKRLEEEKLAQEKAKKEKERVIKERIKMLREKRENIEARKEKEYEIQKKGEERVKIALRRYNSYQNLHRAEPSKDRKRAKRVREYSLDKLKAHEKLYEKFKLEEEEKMLKRVEESRERMKEQYGKFKHFMIPEVVRKKKKRALMIQRGKELGNKFGEKLLKKVKERNYGDLFEKEDSLELKKRSRRKVDDPWKINEIGNNYLREATKNIKKGRKRKFRSFAEGVAPLIAIDLHKEKSAKTNIPASVSSRLTKKTSSISRYSIPVRIRKKPVNWQKKLKRQIKNPKSDILNGYIKDLNNLDRRAMKYDTLASRSEMLKLDQQKLLSKANKEHLTSVKAKLYLLEEIIDD